MDRQVRFTKILHTCDLCHKETHGFFEMEIEEAIPLLTICKDCNEMLTARRAQLPQQKYLGHITVDVLAATEAEANEKLVKIANRISGVPHRIEGKV